MTNTDAERVSDIVARLRPSFNTDLPVSHAIDKCREEELRNTAAALSRWLVENNALKAEAADKIEAQSKALAEAREYAARLLVSFVTEHCNPVPEWAPLPDLMGVLTQLDNATTITRDMKAALAEATALDAALTSCAAMLAFLRQREGECLGDHPDWLRRIDGIFTAHAAVIAAPVPNPDPSPQPRRTPMAEPDLALSPTLEERSAIRALNRLAKRWPRSLWLFSAAGDLHVMRANDDGTHVYVKGGTGVDPAYVLATIKIPNDGGDW